MTTIADIPGVLAVYATGSRVICDPPPMHTDEDWVVLVAPGSRPSVVDFLLNVGYTHDGKAYPESQFISMRHGVVNLILTECQWFYDRFVLATRIAKELNLLDRDDRVKLFSTLREIGLP